MPKRADLHQYQERMASWIVAKKKSNLFASMGTGKSAATLTAIADLFDDYAISKVLIIAPLRVARTTWPNEIAAWEHTSDLSYKVIAGSPDKRQQQLKGTEHIHIINIDLLAWLVAEAGKRWPYDMVVLDEATSIKSPSSKRFKALRKVLGAINYYVNLTGTPTPQGVGDLWAQCYPIDQGEALGKTLTKFRNRWFNVDFFGYTYTPKANAATEIEEAIKGYSLSLTAKDYLELPEQVNNTIAIELTPTLAKQYKQLESDFILELSQLDVVASNAAVLSGKLLQFTAGALYDEHGNWEEIHNLKIEALRDVVEEAAGMPVLVAYQFKSDLERLCKAFPSGEPLGKDPETVARWNRGEIPLLFIHPASAGHGLSLQHGTNIMAFFSLGWSLEQYQQVIERIGPTRQRQSGYDRPVFIHHLIAKGTIDERVMTVLEGKATVQQALLDALKESTK
jgi:SNF2 family DNA or RNA helicase